MLGKPMKVGRMSACNRKEWSILFNTDNMDTVRQCQQFFMVAISNRAEHYIFILSFVLSFFFFLLFFLAWSQPLQIGCLPYFHIWCGLSANLRCRSETCCTWLAENTGRKKVAKNRHLGIIAQLCRAISSQLRHTSTIGKQTVKHQYLVHKSPQYYELRHTSGWHRSDRLGHPS